MRPNQTWRIFVNNEKQQVNGKKWLKWKTKVLKSIALLLGVIANIAELNQHNWSRTSHISMNFARNANIKCQSTWFSPMSESSANRLNRVWERESENCIVFWRIELNRIAIIFELNHFDNFYNWIGSQCEIEIKFQALLCVIALCVSDEESEHTAVCINAYRVERIVCTKRFDSALSFLSIVYILINVVSVRPAIKLKLAP